MLLYLHILFALLVNTAQARELDTTTCAYVRYADVEAPCFGGGDFGGRGAGGTWNPAA